MSDKFIPHLRQVREAALELPEPELWPSEEYIVELKGGDRSHLLTFKRITYVSRSKGKTYKWAYEGKLFVSTKKK